MKSLKKYLKEDNVVATPANTQGMGNPTPPTDTSLGSEPMCTGKCKTETCKKKRKSLKDFLVKVPKDDK